MKKNLIWGCKRCEKTRKVKWFEEIAFERDGYYVCRECQRYEKQLNQMSIVLDAVESLNVNTTVRNSLKKIRVELNKLIG